MPLQTLPAPIWWPNLLQNVAPAIGTGANMTAVNDYFAIVMMAKEAMAITHVGWRLNAAGGGNVEAGIYQVDTTTGQLTASAGVPTPWATNTTVAYTAPAAGWHLDPLVATANITAGQVFAVGVTLKATPAMNVNSLGSTIYNAGMPYQVTVIGGTPLKALANWFGFALGSSATTFYQLQGLLGGVSAIAANAANTGVASPTQGARFQVPFSCRCVGLQVYQGAVSGDFTAYLLDDAGNVLASRAFVGKQMSNLTTSNAYCYFGTGIVLTPGTWYRAVITATQANPNNCNMYTVAMLSSIYMAMSPGGLNHFYTKSANTPPTATWDDTATNTIPIMDILIDQLDDGTGTGGGTIGVIGG